MALLKQSTAYTRTFIMVDSADHLTAKTGLTVTLTVSKAGAAFAAPAGVVSEVGNGVYKVALTMADTGTLGDLTFHATAAGADPTQWVDQVVAFDPANAASLGLTNLDAAISSRLATAGYTAPPSAASISTTVWGESIRALTDKAGFALSAASVQAIWDAATTALTVAGSVGKRLSDNLDAAVSSRLATSGYTNPPTAAAVSTQVWSEPVPGTFAAGSAGAKLNSAGSAGDPWGTAVPGTYGAGTAGSILGNRLDTTVSSRSSHTAADIWAVGSRTLTSFGTLVADIWGNATRTLSAFGFGVTASSVTDKTGYSLASPPPSAADVAAAVWSAVTRTLTSVSSGGATVAEIWNALVANHAAAGTMGQKLGSFSGAGGSGAIAYTYVVTRQDTGAPLMGVRVEVTTDEAGRNAVAAGTTDAFGKVVFRLDGGSYFFWRTLAGYSFTNPDQELVS